MSEHYRIKPDENGLALRVAYKALRTARGLSTARPGSIYVPNGDGTGTMIGPQAGTDETGGSNGVAPWMGDTIPPGKPTGLTASSAWGIVYVSWAGSIQGGIPADFDHLSIYINDVEVAQLTKSGTVARQGYENGTLVTIYAVAYDAARDQYGELKPNASERSDEIQLTVSDEREEIDAQVEQIRQDAQDAADKADEAWDKAEQQASNVEQAVQAAKDAADAAEAASTGADSALAAANEAQTAARSAAQKADEVASNLSKTADQLAGQITGVTTEINGVKQDVTELSTSVSGAVERAGSALTAATEAKQTATEIRATATQALTTAQGALDKAAEVEITANGLSTSVTAAMDTATSALNKAASVEVTADGIKADIQKNYVSKTDASKTYATQTSLKATSDSLTASIESAATSASAAMDKATQVEATAGSIKTTLSQVSTKLDATADTADAAKSAADKANGSISSTNTKVNQITQDVNGLKQTVSDVTETASDALAKANEVSVTADGIKADISKNYVSKDDASKTYSTKNELEATAEGLRGSISEVSTVADAAQEKALQVEATASGIRTDLNKTTANADSALKKATSLEATADGLSARITEVAGDLSVLAVDYVQNGGFETGDLTGWSKTGLCEDVRVEARGSNNGIGKYRCIIDAGSNAADYGGIASGYFAIVPGHTYQIDVSMVYKDGTSEAVAGLRLSTGGSLIRSSSSKDYGRWLSLSGRCIVPEGTELGVTARVEVLVDGYEHGDELHRMIVDGVSIIDVTLAESANGSAETALKKNAELKATVDEVSSKLDSTASTASSALTKATTAQQTIDGFKNTVESTYVTQTDANNKYATKSSLSSYATTASVTTTANNIRNEVAEKYATVNDIDQANILKNGDFSNGLSNWALDGNTGNVVDDPDLGKALVFRQEGTNGSGSFRIYNTSMNHEYGQAYQVSFYANSGGGTVTLRLGNNLSEKAASVRINATKRRYVVQYESDSNLVFSVWAESTGSVRIGQIKLVMASAVYASQAAVDVLPDQILASVEKEYVSQKDAGSTYYTKGEIDAQNDSISLSVKTSIDGIRIGGRNLLKGTAYEDLSGVEVRGRYATVKAVQGEFKDMPALEIKASSASVSGNKDMFQKLWSNLSVGDNLMLSFWAKGSVSAKMWHRVGGGGSRGGSASGSDAGASSVTTYWKRFTVDLGAVTGAGEVGAVEVVYGFSAAGTFYVGNMKLEVGTKATDWSPAPEDTDQALASIRIGQEDITQTVKDLDGRQNTLQTTVNGFSSRLTQAEKDVDAAQSTADTAKTSAANAAKTATNYLDWSTAGLVVGYTSNQSIGSGTLHGNTRLTSSGVEVRNGSTVLGSFSGSAIRVGQASGRNVYIDGSSIHLRSGSTDLAAFGSSTVEIGKNSRTAQVKMCAGLVTVRGTTSRTSGVAVIEAVKGSGDASSPHVILRADGIYDAEIELDALDAGHAGDNSGSMGDIALRGSRVGIYNGLKSFPLSESYGNLSLGGGVSTYGGATPMWVKRGGLLMLKGRVHTTANDQTICNVNGLIDGISKQASGNRSWVCFGNSSSGAGSFIHVYMDQSGNLKCASTVQFVDLSNIVMCCK